MTRGALLAELPHILAAMQGDLLAKADNFRRENTVQIDSKRAFEEFFLDQTEATLGFALCHYQDDPALEAKIKEKYNVTVRCVPWDLCHEKGPCLFSGAPAQRRALFAKAY
jgi:prolyl-tRNA synthetase